MALVVTVAPPPGLAVYAPGERKYRPVSVAVAPHPELVLERPRYPRPVRRWFRELREWALVYTRPFEIVVAGRIAAARRATGPARDDGARGDERRGEASAPANDRLRIDGRIEYQACDEFVCYLPVEAPLEWTVSLAE